jgi:RNase H-like domain found in reverse transcriptase
LRFLAEELHILGRIIDGHGIRMDPDKVDTVVKWKAPTNRDLLRGFIGSVGYLADDVPGVRLPLGILSAITGDAIPFRWGYTEQQAFNDVKELVQAARDHWRRPLDYSPVADPVWMIMDGSATGIAGVVSQGKNWKTADVAAFYSAKLNSAQQNYPVHEIELMAGIKTMLRHADILQGVRFRWVTDHKGLTYLLNQKNLSGRQARWLEKISSFDFEVVYVLGGENVLADALSRMYAYDFPGTVRARSEYSYVDVVDDDTLQLSTLSRGLPIPMLAGMEVRVMTLHHPPRPESSREFAKRMVSRFALRGPQDRKEGGTMAIDQGLTDEAVTELDVEPPTTDNVLDIVSAEDVEPLETDNALDTVPADGPSAIPNSDEVRQIPTIVNLTIQSTSRLDFVNEIRHKYHGDLEPSRLTK